MKYVFWNLAIGTALLAQTPTPRAAAEAEIAVSLAREAERAARVGVLQLTSVRVGGVSTIAGHPFSATEVNRSVQVLANGARIENKTETKLYRDTEGRTRVEAAGGMTTITDPVARVRSTLNPQTKTATKGAGPGVARTVTVAPRIESGAGIGLEEKQSLGTQVINGVSAIGERVTVTIPRGQIGNDRDLKVTTERWYSSDLQMLVKSVNEDPRFGETVYELTNVQLASPDPSLFQIPTDYAVSEGQGRGGPTVLTVPGIGVAPGAKR